MTDPIDPNYLRTRNVLRVLGPALLVLAVVFGLIAFIDLVITMTSEFRPPRLFWCFFIAGPLGFVGLAMTSAGYAEAIARYNARAAAPPAKDTFNYMAEGTKEGVKSLAQAVKEGLTSPPSSNGDSPITSCPGCGEPNEPAAKFCKKCGKPVSAQFPCKHCQHPNDPDARFCDMCGKPLA